MTGGVIASALTPHPPRIASLSRAPEFERGLILGSREMGEVLRSMKPDLFVINSAHWVTSFNWYVTGQDPHDGICVADEAPDLIPGTPYRRKGDPAFARAFAESLQNADLPCLVNESPHYRWDYGLLVPLLHCDPEAAVPVVGISTCLSADRNECLRVGRLVGTIAKQTGRRVIYMASCALSHRIVRGPEMWPTPERLRMDERFIKLLERGEIDDLLGWFPEYAQAAVAEMGGRVLATMLGVLDSMHRDGTRLRGQQYGDYAQSSGSGNANVAVRPA